MRMIDGLRRRISVLSAVGIAVLTAASLGSADARSNREAMRDLQARRARVPMLAVVALAEQRVTIYDAAGKMLQAPVSTGATGLETPAGIYSVVQKKEEHHSNIYEDGSMPFMQRITWTGIALHGGVLPGYPASHGCVRMPLPFAQSLFGLTDIGLRVIIVPRDIHPIDISHPLLFKPKAPPERPAASGLPALRATGGEQGATPIASEVAPQGSARRLEIFKSLAAARSLEAAAASKRASEAKTAAARRAAEAAPAARMLRAAQANLSKAEELLQRAERALETAPLEGSTQAAQGKDKALAIVARAQQELESAKLQSQAKLDAAERASREAVSAEAKKEAALEAAEEAARNTSPVSVFISRKTQRLYVRQGYQPVFEGPVFIRDPDKPIGTYVFTVLSDLNGGADVRWSVVSMYSAKDHPKPAEQGRHAGAHNTEAAAADQVGARAALDRISLADDVRDRIAQGVLPGSSLIVSDEGAHTETGKDTDFVVLISGEAQGGIKNRRREFMARPRGNGFFGGYGFGLF
jgi:L,D-transpeptidase catalytic domain